MARLGCKTQLLVRGDRILDREEPEVSEVLFTAFQQEGIAIHFHTTVEQVDYQDGVFQLTTNQGNALEAEALLIVTGRKPNTQALNAAATRVELDSHGYIKVDEHFRTNCEGVYAIGDVSGQPAFTHVSWEDYRRLQAILNGQERTRNDRVLGYAVCTEPQVGRAGMTLPQAQQQGMNARSVRLPMSQIARAIEWGHEFGFYEMVIDQDTDKILGATLLGYEAAEIVRVFLDLIEVGATWQLLEQAVHIHPTYGEALPSLARLLVPQKPHSEI